MNNNILIHELKSYKKHFLFWSIGMIVLILSSMKKFETFKFTGLSINDLMSKFPRSVQSLFGLNGLDLTTAIGFYGLTFLYVILLALTHASLLGSDILSKEERDKTDEFLFVKPANRIKILSQKLASGFIMLLGLNLVTLVSSILITKRLTDDKNITSEITHLVIALLLLQILFFSLGFLSAAFMSRGRNTATLPLTVLIISYIFYVLIGINEKLDFLKFLSPINYLDVKNIIKTQNIPLELMIMSITISVISITTAFRFFNNKDLM